VRGRGEGGNSSFVVVRKRKKAGVLLLSHIPGNSKILTGGGQTSEASISIYLGREKKRTVLCLRRLTICSVERGLQALRDKKKEGGEDQSLIVKERKKGLPVLAQSLREWNRLGAEAPGRKEGGEGVVVDSTPGPAQKREEGGGVTTSPSWLTLSHAMK